MRIILQPNEYDVQIVEGLSMVAGDNTISLMGHADIRVTEIKNGKRHIIGASAGQQYSTIAMARELDAMLRPDQEAAQQTEIHIQDQAITELAQALRLLDIQLLGIFGDKSFPRRLRESDPVRMVHSSLARSLDLVSNEHSLYTEAPSPENLMDRLESARAYYCSQRWRRAGAPPAYDDAIITALTKATEVMAKHIEYITTHARNHAAQARIASVGAEASRHAATLIDWSQPEPQRACCTASVESC